MSKLTFSFYFQQDNPLIGKIIEEKGFEFLEYTTKKAEELGFKVVFYPDHFMLPNNNTLLSCWSILSALAKVTKNLKLCSLVSPVPLYPIYLLSKNVVTLDNISKGRAMFGIGSGWYEKEFKAYNVPFLTLKERVEMTEEAIQIFKLLCEKDKVSFEGKYYKISDASFYPKPIQKPHPPIWIGGSSNRTLRITAKYAQGWIPYEQPLDIMKERIEKLKSMLAENDRKEDDVEIAMSFRCIVSDKKKEVEETMKILNLQKEFISPYSGVRSRVIAGTTEEVIEELRSYTDIGVRHFCFGIQPSQKIIEGLEFVKDKVIPSL
jgi:FMNH2-dependent dimethyl sulfone monooxygenase